MLTLPSSKVLFVIHSSVIVYYSAACIRVLDCDMKQLVAFEMRCDRVLAIKWQDKITNEEVRTRTGRRESDRHNSKKKAIRTYLSYT